MENPRKIQFTVPLLEPHLDPEAAEQVRGHRGDTGGTPGGAGGAAGPRRAASRGGSGGLRGAPGGSGGHGPAGGGTAGPGVTRGQRRHEGAAPGAGATRRCPRSPAGPWGGGGRCQGHVPALRDATGTPGTPGPCSGQGRSQHGPALGVTPRGHGRGPPSPSCRLPGVQRGPLGPTSPAGL
uniref:Uncharacterized protein n=1 Tax=Junco hyemalis TaxID=40217 RepID=A0A8C5JN28_JUNHY